VEGSLRANSVQFTQLTDRRQQNLPVDSERRIINQINKYDSAANKENSVFLEGFLSTIPNARRILNLEDDIKNHDPAKAIGVGALALLYSKEDLRDLLSIVGLSKSQAPKGYHSKYKFFAGTHLQKYLEKSKWGQYLLYDVDTTLADTTIGKKLYSLLNVKDEVEIFEKETKFPFCDIEKMPREYVKFEGSFASKLAGLSMNRITKLGLLFLILLEIPSIYNAIKKENKYSQIVKSGINVLSSTICGAVLSSALSLATGSPAASVIGLGLGMFIGNKFSKFICRD